MRPGVSRMPGRVRGNRLGDAPLVRTQRDPRACQRLKGRRRRARSVPWWPRPQDRPREREEASTEKRSACRWFADACEHHARARQHNGEDQQRPPARQLVLAQAPLGTSHQHSLPEKGLLQILGIGIERLGHRHPLHRRLPAWRVRRTTTTRCFRVELLQDRAEAVPIHPSGCPRRRRFYRERLRPCQAPAASRFACVRISERMRSRRGSVSRSTCVIVAATAGWTSAIAACNACATAR